MKYVVLIVLAAFVGCNKKAAPSLPDLEIPPSCAQQIVMKQCDTKVNPPKCKSSLVVYQPASCAIVHMNSGESK
jgi:hypothetical protein